MASQRTEYSSLLASLQPEQAINVLNDRVSLINKVNSDIADWLQERRKIEETYVAGLRKLARRQQQDGSLAFGVFQTPWQRIVAGVENLAQSHEAYASKIETDVENPLRQFATKNREMQAVNTTQGNLSAIARDLNSAQKKADKLNAKGSRKADGAISGVDDAARTWESQAPYVFEQLQALDETRVNHLRDVLTQFQTHEVDQIEKARTSAESCLNALLNIETSDEIKTFVARVSDGRADLARRRSSTTTSARPQSSSTQVPPTPPPPRLTEDRRTQRQETVASQDRLAPLPEKPEKSRLGGLKRFSTVVSRKKSHAPPPPPSMAEKKKDKSRSFAPFRRGDSSRSFQDLEATSQDITPTVSTDAAQEQQSFEPPPGPPPKSQPEQPEPARPIINGTSEAESSLQPPLEPTHVTSTGRETSIQQPQAVSQLNDYQHTSINDPISQAQQEASLAQPDNEELHRNLTIRDKPIQEDESEAQLAMTNMANQLRLQAQSSGLNRVQGSVRGRRDVRNTMFIPNLTNIPGSSAAAPSNPTAQALGSISAAAVTTPPAAPITPNTTGNAGDIASPIQRTGVPGVMLEDRPGSDTQSIHSQHSLAGLAQHPELHEPGLNVSIIETVNSWFTEAGVSRSFVVGEIGLAYNTSTGTTESGHESIRLQNFQVLEKVAANPTFVKELKSTDGTAAEEQAGSYNVALSAIRRSAPTVGLKYQVHIDEANLAHYSPILVTPAWQLVEGQASVIVLYSLNPAFTLNNAATLTLHNVVLSVTLDITGEGTGKPTSAMMAPTQGASFRRKAGAVVWRFAELTLKPEHERLLVRFVVEGGLAKKGSVEVKFEAPGLISSTLGVEKMAAGPSKVDDPFADDGGSERASAEEKRWEPIAAKKMLVSGRYTAS